MEFDSVYFLFNIISVFSLLLLLLRVLPAKQRFEYGCGIRMQTAFAVCGEYFIVARAIFDVSEVLTADK